VTRSRSIRRPRAAIGSTAGTASLVMLLVAGGCGPGVHDVRFSPTPSFEPPATGTRVMVTVLDGSAEKSGILLGRMIVSYADYPEQRYVLAGEDSFAARLGRDVVSALRARGYRAQGQSDTSSEAPGDAIALTIKPVTHSIDIMAGTSDVVFDGAFVFECIATVGGAPSAAWSETIDHHVRKQQFGMGRSRTSEGVYWSAVVEIVHRFSTALPPSP
jgi:hypothetical protein